MSRELENKLQALRIPLMGAKSRERDFDMRDSRFFRDTGLALVAVSLW
jgi:hypothetical protein